MSISTRPAAGEYAEYYAGYIALVPDGDLLTHLRAQRERTVDLLAALDDEQAARRYAPGKWSVKQVLGHMIDVERLFAFRALAIARRDPSDQPSMDQDRWMDAVDFDARRIASLVAEYRAVRDASLALIGSFDDAQADCRGRASGFPFTVRSLVYMLAGHELHHLGVLRARYGLGGPSGGPR